MNEKSKRLLWQIHLSTALVIMFAAGGLLYVNCRIRYGQDPTTEDRWTGYGWPQIAFNEVGMIQIPDDWDGDLRDESKFKYTRNLQVVYSGLAVDTLVAASLLGLLIIVCESMNRRSQLNLLPTAERAVPRE